MPHTLKKDLGHSPLEHIKAAVRATKIETYRTHDNATSSLDKHMMEAIGVFIRRKINDGVEDDTPRDVLKSVLTRCKNTSPIDDTPRDVLKSVLTRCNSPIDDDLLAPPPRIRRLRAQSQAE